MTPKAQQIAIAAACGWTEIEGCTCREWQSRGCPPEWTAHKKHLPDYLNDLNACAEFEEVLLPDNAAYSQRNFYAAELGRITRNDNGRGWKPLSNDDCFVILHATAAQRCEAFLRTLNLWQP